MDPTYVCAGAPPPLPPLTPLRLPPRYSPPSIPRMNIPIPIPLRPLSPSITIFPLPTAILPPLNSIPLRQINLNLPSLQKEETSCCNMKRILRIIQIAALAILSNIALFFNDAALGSVVSLAAVIGASALFVGVTILLEFRDL